MDNSRSTANRSPALRLLAIAAAAALFIIAPTAQARQHHGRADANGRPGQFDYYVLSLSWAPTYCLTHADDGAECSGKGYGFVLHGLWPQYEDGGYPAACPSQFELSAAASAKGRSIYPSERLMRHEWREHGTCSGLEPLEYFSTADRATAVVAIPSAMQAPRADQDLSAERVVNLFQSANPALPWHALQAMCNRSELSEIRVCLTRDLRPRSCGRKVRSNCPAVALHIPAAR